MKLFAMNIRSGLLITALGAMIALSAARSFSDEAPTDDWVAPARASRVPNPVKADAASIEKGKAVFVTNCEPCHGNAGKGDGPAAIALNPKPKDLSDPKIQAQTDGSMFWKITTGKKPMPAYEKLIPAEEDRWNVINYVRTLAPAAPATQP